MRKWIYALLTFTLLSCFSSVYANEKADFTASQQVITQWFAAMKSGEVEKAGSYLAPQFVSIHTDGIVRNKNQEIELIKNLNMKDYKLTDFKFAQSGNIITVTYKDNGVENIDNQSIAPVAAGRMAVLQKQGKKWIIIAYANLDQIK